MLIPQVPIQPTPTIVTQPQTLPNVLPQVLTQAVAPISQRAIPPTEKADRGYKSRRRGEKDGENQPDDSIKQEGDHVNISV